ncbi:MAG TPA: plastocyanin/azurin family copper-binding protein [Actinomycetota bacterium]|nr:plastocyanin/azurin family copper-binding protein [Actinomycetota bacterium]
MTKLSTRALRRLAIVTVLAAAVLTACNTSDRVSGGSGSDAVVTVSGLAFDPASLEVPAGTQVTWTNDDSVAHTVTSGAQGEQGAPGVTEDEPARPDGLFDADLAEEGDELSFTFEEAGTYRYYCDVHRQMRGEIVVE